MSTIFKSYFALFYKVFLGGTTVAFLIYFKRKDPSSTQSPITNDSAITTLPGAIATNQPVRKNNSFDNNDICNCKNYNLYDRTVLSKPFFLWN